MFDLRTHNGVITALNPKTGNHRTFAIRTQKEDATFAPGRRIVALLIGPDNYQGFGFIFNGRVSLWKKYRTSEVYQYYQRMLAAPANFPLEYNFEGRCRCCNRQLTTPESVRSGIGPICAEKGAMV